MFSKIICIAAAFLSFWSVHVRAKTCSSCPYARSGAYQRTAPAGLYTQSAYAQTGANVQAGACPQAPVVSPIPESAPLAYESGFTFGIGNGYEFGFARLRGVSGFSLSSVYSDFSYERQFIDSLGVFDYAEFPMVANIEKDPGLTGGYFGSLQMGWDCKLRDSILVGGILLEGGFGTGRMRALYPVYIYNGNAVFDEQVIQDYAKMRHRGYMTSSLKAGFAMGRALLFLKVGYAGDSWRIQLPYLASKSKWVSSLLVGLGVDLNMTRHWLIGISSDVRLGGNVQFKNIVSTYDMLAIKMRPYITNTILWIKYKIPTCN